MPSKRIITPEMASLQDQLNGSQDFFDFEKPAPKFSLLDKYKASSSRIKSSYWRVDMPTDDCLSKLTCLSVDRELVAVGSTASHDNLKVYGLDQAHTHMVHKTSISIPDIHAIRWLYNPNEDTDEEDPIKFLLTGHSGGIANLIMLPLASDSGIENAQIIKHFNHDKHITDTSDIRIANNGKPTNTIYKMDVTPYCWHSCNKNSMLSIYKESVFLWDTTRSLYPVLKSKARGISSFDTCLSTDGLLALSGSFGISLFDMRSAISGSDASFFIPDRMNKECTEITWCKQDSNYLCAADLDDTLTIWDVRMLQPLASLESHSDTVTSLQWNKFDSLYSSSSEGSVIYWDLSLLDKNATKPVKCTLKNGFNTDVSYNEVGTLLPVSNNNVIDMVSLTDMETLTMDQSFLGLHAKIEDQQIEAPQNNSSDTLVEFRQSVKQKTTQQQSARPAKTTASTFLSHNHTFSESSETLLPPPRHLPPNTIMIDNMLYI